MIYCICKNLRNPRWCRASRDPALCVFPSFPLPCLSLARSHYSSLYTHARTHARSPVRFAFAKNLVFFRLHGLPCLTGVFLSVSVLSLLSYLSPPLFLSPSHSLFRAYIYIYTHTVGVILSLSFSLVHRFPRRAVHSRMYTPPFCCSLDLLSLSPLWSSLLSSSSSS